MRWSRWGILCGAVVMGAVLLLTAWTNQRRVEALSATVTRGQGVLVLDSIRRALHGSGGAPTQADLDTLVDEFADQGLRYLAIASRPPIESGTALGGPLDPARLRPGPTPVTVEPLLGRIRLILHGPGRRHGWHRMRGWRQRALSRSRVEDGPEDTQGPGMMSMEPRDRGRGSAPPAIVIEIEPVAAAALRGQARRALLINGVAALLLLLAALIAVRWLGRQAARDEQHRRERHLANLGEMSAVLAHEIRNPLASLKGHAQLLAEVLPPDSREHAKAERVVREAVRLEHLTTGLLQFVRTGTLARREADPAAVARAAVAEAAPEHSAQVAVDDVGAPSTWTFDPDRMQEVLANLVRNALQAVPAGADAEAATAPSEVGGENSAGSGAAPAEVAAPVELRVTSERGALVYELRDRGDGIPPGQEDAIFEPFHTRRVRGTGLGLAVARRVVELHGGSIAAYNHPEGGAVFRILLPKSSRHQGSGSNPHQGSGRAHEARP